MMWSRRNKVFCLSWKHQEEGWPLGLRPVNARIGGRHHHHHEQVSAGSISFSSLLSPFSSDLDSQSMGSFFRDKSCTLGNLIGISSFLDFSRRSNRTRMDQTASKNHQQPKNLKTYKPWIFSICSKLKTNSTVISHNKIITEANDGRNNVQSLGHFLMVERRAIGPTTGSTPTIRMSVSEN